MFASSLVLPMVKVYALEEEQEELKLYLNEPEVLAVRTPKRIVIGNPNIVDVTNVSKNEITLNPKAIGTTSFILDDNFGEQFYKIRVLPEDIRDIKERVDNLLKSLNLPNVYTQTAEEEGKVLILGSVKNNADREKISLALGPLKEKTIDLIALKEEEAVVEIDVQVLELNKDATKTLGFTMPSAISVVETPGRFSKAFRASFDAIFHVFDWPRSDFTARLDALVQEGKAKILSRPRLACQSGKEAEMIVGGEKPILTTQTVTGGGTGTEVDYKEFGIKLKIKPTVSDVDNIQLALNVEVSDVGTADTLGSSTAPTAKAYPLSKRNVSTQIYLKDGQTLAIGGLIKQKKEEDLTKTAFLGDIPILGALFRKRTTKIGGGQGERGDTELFITLTPRIVSQKQAPQVKRQDSPQEYAAAIQKYILQNLTYPQAARKQSLQGTVKLSMLISSAGKLLEVKVKSSSGSKVLDDNAVSVVKNIPSYPAFPASIESKELWIDIPIVYKLD